MYSHSTGLAIKLTSTTLDTKYGNTLKTFIFSAFSYEQEAQSSGEHTIDIKSAIFHLNLLLHGLLLMADTRRLTLHDLEVRSGAH